MILNIFVLIGILVAFSVIAGLCVGGFRTFLLRGRKGREEESMILLHLGER
jgi:alkylated DNA repair dioxygenase AlkB